jgi:hypothetical protein
LRAAGLAAVDFLAAGFLVVVFEPVAFLTVDAAFFAAGFAFAAAFFATGLALLATFFAAPAAFLAAGLEAVDFLAVVARLAAGLAAVLRAVVAFFAVDVVRAAGLRAVVFFAGARLAGGMGEALLRVGCRELTRKRGRLLRKLDVLHARLRP